MTTSKIYTFRGTIAWNALFHGVKIWALLHPELTAKQVRSNWSGEQAYIILPILYNNCRRCLGNTFSWWHAVINVENVIGVTENGISIFIRKLAKRSGNVHGDTFYSA